MDVDFPSAAQESRFALQRVIMIDSYTQGRITELPIAGGTAIVGANGGGKTSLLQLIPAFFGARPDLIVRPVSNQKNFARYYLPRSTSYIVYEYRRDDSMCCAVLCSDASGDGVEYRFVRGEYDQDWFVHDDKTTLVASSNLAERLKLAGVNCSRKMPLDNYRAIIQGKRMHGSDLAQHRRDITDYAYCPSSRSLPHIERIVFGMFMRKSNFADLQRMIVSTVTDTSKNIALGAERKKIEAWPDACESYVKVMAEVPKMDEAQAAYMNVMAAEHELRTIHGRLIAFDRTLEGDEVEQGKLLAIAKDELEKAEDRHRGERQVVVDKIHAVSNEMKEREAKLQKLAEQNENYRQRDVEVLASWHSREEAFAKECDQLRQRKTALVEQQANIEEEYGRLLRELELCHKDRLIAFAHQKSQAKDEFQAQREVLQAEGTREEDEARQSFSEAEMALQQEVDAAAEALGRARESLDNPQPDPELVAIADQQQSNLNEARSRYDEATHAHAEAQAAYKRALDAFGRQEHALHGTQDEIRQAEFRLDGLLRQANPDEDSLLSFLRRERSDWTVDIAKVLREDLLGRTDLGPAIGSIQDSVYGLLLNLDVVATPLAADESALQQEVEAVREEIKRLRARQDDQDGDLAKRGAERATAEGVADQRSAHAAISKAALESQEQLLRSARNDVSRSRDAAKDKAKEVFERARTTAEASRQRLVEHKGRLDKEVVSIRNRQAMRASELQVKFNQWMTEIENEEASEAEGFNKSCQDIEAERLAKLAADGVDTKALTKLEEAIKEVEKKLKAIEASRNLIAEWRLWLESDWAQKPVHEAALGKAMREKEVFEAEKAAVVSAWSEDATRRKGRIAGITQKISEIGTTRTKVAKLRDALERHPANLNELPEYNPAWQLALLVEQSNTQLRSLGDSEEELKQNINALKRAFTATRHSPADQYYETQRQIIGPDLAANPREWIPAFKAWFASEHQHCLNLLRVDARTIADAVADFHQRMDTFQSKIRKFNREMQANIDSNQGFRSIGGLTVEIVSSIHELEYWNTVVKVAQSRLDWMRDDALALPPPEFSLALRELLNHWQLKEGIQAELTGLVRIQGEVIENGNRRPFKKAEDLEHISSNGLSYIVMVLLFLAFINRVRGEASVNIVWALDEIGALDTPNTVLLVEILKRNNVTLVTACPDPKPDVLAGFRNRRSISNDRRIFDPSVAVHSRQAQARNEIGVAHV